MSKYKSLYQLMEQSEEEKAKNSIEAIIKTDWGGTNEEQYKNIQLMLGLAGNNSKTANKFLKKINSFTSSLDSNDF